MDWRSVESVCGGVAAAVVVRGGRECSNEKPGIVLCTLSAGH